MFTSIVGHLGELNKKNKFFQLKVRSDIKLTRLTEITPYMKGVLLNAPALYAKVRLFLWTLLFKTVKNFSVKSGALRRTPFIYGVISVSLLSFNVAPYFQLKKLVFF